VWRCVPESKRRSASIILQTRSELREPACAIVVAGKQAQPIARDCAIRPGRQDQKPQTGDRHRAVKGAQEGQEGSAEEEGASVPATAIPSRAAVRGVSHRAAQSAAFRKPTLPWLFCAEQAYRNVIYLPGAGQFEDP
jgi:hypothetical protein